MLPQLRSVDQFPIVAPLGVRFWDDAARAVVGEGLLVEAYPAGRPDRRTAGFANRVGVYVLRGLARLREAEGGAGDE
ncbi:MAG: hypothetical protein HGA45_39435, partial [Chloroflexales bacterium]|nr:hypothetical protein [Chloroflexales bacterium]